MGKYYERYREGTNVLLLDPDVAQEFPDSDSVNRILRRVLRDRRKGGTSSEASSPKYHGLPSKPTSSR